MNTPNRRKVSALVTAVIVGAGIALSNTACDVSDRSTPDKSSNMHMPVEPVPETATVLQISTIITEYAADWRVATANAEACRLLWTVPPDNIQEQEGAVTCYIDEQNAIIAARYALGNLELFTPPAEVLSLYEDTLNALGRIKEVDLVGVLW
ncbi:hypothetical protein [Xylanimonas sp. McL0601]|uniref:hypothetical protein n=1 Tax=Xylanimonas sp. McL0601 TaxID=3414739 RepID=UPI003CF8EF73